MGFWWLSYKEYTYSTRAAEVGSIPRWRGCPGGGHDSPLQHTCLENPMDRGVWSATVIGLQIFGHNWSYLTLMHHTFLKKKALLRSSLHIIKFTLSIYQFSDFLKIHLQCYATITTMQFYKSFIRLNTFCMLFWSHLTFQFSILYRFSYSGTLHINSQCNICFFAYNFYP